MKTKFAFVFSAFGFASFGNAADDTSVYTHKTACPEYPYVQNEKGETIPWEITEYCGKTNFFGDTPILPLSAGYAIVLGFGLFFSLFTSLLVWLDAKILGTKYDSEQFNTAGRTVKTGLTASVIVSQWTWAATLLQSSNVAHQYGVSGPFWYASGATIQILLFGVLAIEIKKKAPTAHTMCEIVLYRWGKTAHKVFLCFALLTNMIVTAMLLLGGAAVVNALTGMNIFLASFLMPMGVILYTMSGGLKATFLASYIHTSVIFVILLLFVLVVYTASDDLGSPTKVYANLQSITSIFPVPDNKEGSYVTMISGGGLIFGIINIVGNFGTVFCDQSYWQSAIAAKPSAAHKGYLMGGMVWFTIPFALATSLGLSALALDLPVSVDEANSGLVPPAAAVHFWGPGGAYAIAIMLFMAITSTGSAELIAVSSLFVYDVYRVYINTEATGKDILKWSRVIIVGFGCFMGCLACVLQVMGLSLGWVYLFMGIVIGSAVIPVSYSLLWSKATANGAITGAVVGQIAAVVTWCITASAMEGEVTIATLGGSYPMLAGNLVAILGSGLICTVMSLAKPDAYDWTSTKEIPLISDDPSNPARLPDDDIELDKASTWIKRWGVGFTLVIVVLWPVLSLPAGVFSEGYFSFWVWVSVIWAIVATFAIITLPLVESFREMAGAMKKGSPSKEGATEENQK